MDNPKVIIHNTRFTIGKILSCIVACIILVACGATTHNTPTIKNRQSTVALWPFSDSSTIDTIHLGRIREGEIVTSNFTVRNISSSPLVIIDIKVACGCAKATFDTSPVMPGSERLVDFTFNSSGRRGAQIKYFDLQSADGQNLKIFFDADVI